MSGCSATQPGRAAGPILPNRPQPQPALNVKKHRAEIEIGEVLEKLNV